jgi:hypothetical protein
MRIPVKGSTQEETATPRQPFGTGDYNRNVFGKQTTQDVVSTGFSRSVRFAVEVDGVKYKLLSYFPIGREAAADSSIALHTYFPSTHTYEKRIDRPPRDLSPEEGIIYLSDYEAEARKFQVKKFSFHQSGVLTRKDKHGNRISDDPDDRSISFQSISDFIRLCYIYPAYYPRYPKVDPTEGKDYNMIVLPKESAKVPPIIDVRISRSEASPPLEAKLKEIYMTFQAFRDRATLEKCGLDIYIVFRVSSNEGFPRAEALFTELN